MTAAKFRRVTQLRKEAAKILRISNELEAEIELESEPIMLRSGIKTSIWKEINAEIILLRVIDEYKSRRKRQLYIPKEFLAEPAWDILLDLFASRIQNKNISVTSACIAADVPPTTALRWLGILEQMGFVERVDSRFDQRVTWVRLTDSATQSMFEYFDDDSSNENTNINKIDEYLFSGNQSE